MPALKGASTLRHLAALPRFLRRPLSLDGCREAISHFAQHRTDSLTRVLDHIYASADSPYRKLLDHAGISCERAVGWLREEGVEATLGRLYDAGVYLTLEEVKGRRPIRRGRLELEATPADFDNPVRTAGFESRSSGSRGPRTRVLIDHDLLAYEAGHILLWLEAHGLTGRPVALWRPVPPAVAGIKDVLRHAKAGQPVQRWFSPVPVDFGRDGWPHALFVAASGVVSRFAGRPLAMPKHVPVRDAVVVARWLAEQEGRALLDAATSSAVRVCLAARDAGLDISGTVFRVGGEPVTPARARVATALGCRMLSRYSMAEVGTIGMTCARPDAVDDVHLLTDKFGVLQRPKEVARGHHVDALMLTTLLPFSPKLFLNVDVGDCAVMRERRCGCALDSVGLGLHLHTVRSYEKLTSAGMHFLGDELVELLDDVLPARFGGAPGDYQLVEEEHADGLPRVLLFVHPRLGDMDSDLVARTALEALGSRSRVRRTMADAWRDNLVLEVVRREPETNAAGKILSLHVRTLTQR